MEVAEEEVEMEEERMAVGRTNMVEKDHLAR